MTQLIIVESSAVPQPGRGGEDREDGGERKRKATNMQHIIIHGRVQIILLIDKLEN